MATVPSIKASVEQTVALSKFLVTKGLKSSECVEWLKSQSYKVRGVSFSATNVAFCMAGYELAVSELPKPKPRATRATKAKP